MTVLRKTPAMFLLAASFMCQQVRCQDTVQEHYYRISGKALGGELTIACVRTPNANYYSVQTKAGESAESVGKRIVLPLALKFSGGSFTDFSGAGGFVFAGTEAGLGIPEPPMSVSCSYDIEKDEIILNWVNPKGGYTGVGIMAWDANWPGVGGAPGERPFTGNSRIMREARKRGIDITDTDLRVIGWCGGQWAKTATTWEGGTPSNAGAMHLSYNAQDELFGIPFWAGVAPNWKSWMAGGKAQDAEFEQGKGPGRDGNATPYNPIEKPTDKPFYQIVRTKKPQVQAGIWRKFLGLTPGHKYRVTTLLNTLEMDKAKGDWSLSFHAAWNAPGGKDFAPEQLSGAAALPDGSKGPKAAQMVSYGAGQTTKGEWAYSSTDPAQQCPGREIGDITLPEKVDTITVWLRHSAAESKGVGYLWVKLEDLSMPPLPQKPAK